MSVTSQFSTQLQAALGALLNPLDPRDQHGRLRIARFTFTQVGQGAINSVAILCRLPAGPLFLVRSVVLNSALGASRTMDLGHNGFSPITGADVAAAPTAFATAIGVSAAGTQRTEIGQLFNARQPFTFQARIQGGTFDAANTLNGWIEYVQD